MTKYFFAFFLLCSAAFANEEWEAFYKEFRKSYRRADNTLKIELIKKMTAFDIKEAAEELAEELNRSTTPIEVKITISNILLGYKSKEVQDFLIAYLKKQSNPDCLFLYTIYKMNLPAANDIFVSLAFRSANSETVAISLRAIGQNKVQKNDVILKIIAKTDKRERLWVRKSAIEALGGIESTLGVPRLYELMSDKVLYSYAIDSMERLTGNLLGNNKVQWEKWFKENPKFKPVNTELETFMKDKTARLEKEKKELNNGIDDASKFYGMEVTGENIMFVLDRSGSMSSSTKSYPSRLDQLKAEFSQMMDGIPDGTNLGLILFPHAVYPKKGIDTVDAKCREQIKNYIKDLTPTGGTPTGAAMTYLFENIADKKQIDTIYLLSDGSPDTPPEEVRQLIKGLNSSKFIQINTISIGDDSQFLKDVAADNNGSYLYIP